MTSQSQAKRIALTNNWRQPKWVIIAIAVIMVIALLLWGGYRWTTPPISFQINGQSHTIRLYQPTVATVLGEMGVTLFPEDKVQPGLEATLSSGDKITITWARPVSIVADGQTREHLTHAQRIGDILHEIGLRLDTQDEVYLEDHLTSLTESLPQNGEAPLLARRPNSVQLAIKRAIPVTLQDGPLHTTFFSRQATIGEALTAQQISYSPNDLIRPQTDTPLFSGMHIFLERAIPVTLTVDGQTYSTSTRLSTVGELLNQEGIFLMGQDFSRPAAHTPLSPELHIEIIRVKEALEIEQDVTLFETQWLPDEALDLDKQEVRQEGATGIVKTRTRVRYENGQEVWREIEDEWQDQVAQDRIIAYGTKITIRTLDTPNGPIEYWRKISMLSTGYQAATSGKAYDHPRYGITRSGLPAGFGVVAVDPTVIPLLTDLYVPDYGPAIAGDTGGRVLGKHIDLGFDDDQEIPDLYGWRDVYILTPVPAPDQIRYVLPNWPQR